MFRYFNKFTSELLIFMTFEYQVNYHQQLYLIPSDVNGGTGAYAQNLVNKINMICRSFSSHVEK